MDGFERDRPDADDGESARTDEPFARWAAARERLRNDGAMTPERDGAAGTTVPDNLARTVTRLRKDLEDERNLRTEAEATAEELARLLSRERDERIAAEERADAVFAELELATHQSTGFSPSPHPRSRARRALRRVKRKR